MTESASTGGKRGTPVLRQMRRDPAAQPFLVIWELTQACDLACKHCRASARTERSSGELSREEARALFEQVAAFGSPPPLFVMTGGDPFKRPDLYELIADARARGLSVAVAPSATDMLTEANIARLHDAGVTALSLSVDGSSPSIHDAFRGVPGVLDRTLHAWRVAREVGLRVQINTTVSPANLANLSDIARLVQAEGAMTWSVFFVVPTGRGATLGRLSAAEMEDVLHFLYDVGHLLSVKTTEAPQFRRVCIQRQILEERGLDPVETLGLGETYVKLRAGLRAVAPEGGTRVRRPPLAIGAANGFVFVSHTGEVTPSGFLPLSGGNVRRRSLVDIYRSSPLFRRLRDPGQLKGRCGRCEFAGVCGGSRSRAFAITGDALQEEEMCAYEPGSFPFADAIAAQLDVERRVAAG